MFKFLQKSKYNDLCYNPSGRVTEPSDIAEALVALSATESNWLTGNTINVDGAEDITVL